MIFAFGPGAFAAIDQVLQPFAEMFPAENVRHHFVGQDDSKGLYAKELHIPAGFILRSHHHPYDHLSILASGYVRFDTPGESRLIHGPAAITVRKGVTHTLRAITDAVWFCIHPTDETDEAKVDDVILSKGET